jgi:hypothetical protein
MIHRASSDAGRDAALHQRREEKKNHTPPHVAIISRRSFTNKQTLQLNPE